MSAGAKQDYYSTLIPNLYFLDELGGYNPSPSSLSVRVPYGRDLYVCYAPYESAPANKYFSLPSPYVASGYNFYFFVEKDYRVKFPFPAYVEEPVYVPDSLLPALFNPPTLNQDGSLGGGAGLIFIRFTAGSGRPITFRPGYLPGTRCPVAANDDFELDVATTPLTVAPGGRVSTELVLSGHSSFSGEVKLSCSNLPAGASCNFTRTSVEVGPEVYVPNRVMISIPEGSGTPKPSTSEVVIHAAFGSEIHSATVNLTVR
jgi:hypothetical protein